MGAIAPVLCSCADVALRIFGLNEEYSSSLGGTQSAGSRPRRNNFKASLNILALNFILAPEVQAKLLAEGFSNLEELRFLFDNEEHVGRWVSKIGLGDRAMLETAQLCRAWSAVRLNFSTLRSL